MVLDATGDPSVELQQYLPFTVLKHNGCTKWEYYLLRLQQYLPFTVLKLPWAHGLVFRIEELQQYLPFTVLKLQKAIDYYLDDNEVATVLTVYGIETIN